MKSYAYLLASLMIVSSDQSLNNKLCLLFVNSEKKYCLAILFKGTRIRNMKYYRAVKNCQTTTMIILT